MGCCECGWGGVAGLTWSLANTMSIMRDIGRWEDWIRTGRHVSL